jgi:acetyl-CoA carboxylase biotin carboxyl carrier protein
MILAANDIAELVEHMRCLGVAEIEIADGDEMLRVALPEAVEQPARTTISGPTVIAATACGIFVHGHPAREVTPSIGARVEAGEIVGVIAAGPLLRPIAAPAAGTLTRLLCEPGQRVDFGTPLFAIAPLHPPPDPRKRKDV